MSWGCSLVVVILFLFLIACAPQAAPAAPISSAPVPSSPQPQAVPAAVPLIKNAPYPNAAKLFLNWFLSRDGQLIFSRAAKLPSARLDGPQDQVHPQFRLGPEVKIIDYNTTDWTNQPKDMELAAEILKIRR